MLLSLQVSFFLLILVLKSEDGIIEDDIDIIRPHHTFCWAVWLTHSLLCILLYRMLIPIRQVHVETSAKDCKTLNKIADRVADIAPLKQWLADRPKTMF
jgi:hypothetical protein